MPRERAGAPRSIADGGGPARHNRHFRNPL